MRKTARRAGASVVLVLAAGEDTGREAFELGLDPRCGGRTGRGDHMRVGRRVGARRAGGPRSFPNCLRAGDQGACRCGTRCTRPLLRPKPWPSATAVWIVAPSSARDPPHVRDDAFGAGVERARRRAAERDRAGRGGRRSRPGRRRGRRVRAHRRVALARRRAPLARATSPHRAEVAACSGRRARLRRPRRRGRAPQRRRGRRRRRRMISATSAQLIRVLTWRRAA